MKKIIFVVIAMITCLCLCGCPQPSSPAEPEPEIHPYGYGTTAVAGETYHLIVGKFDSLSARDEVFRLDDAETEHFLERAGQADRAREVCSAYTHTYVVDGHFTVEQLLQACEYIETLEIISDNDVNNMSHNIDNMSHNVHNGYLDTVMICGMHEEYWIYLVAD